MSVMMKILWRMTRPENNIEVAKNNIEVEVQWSRTLITPPADPDLVPNT